MKTPIIDGQSIEQFIPANLRGMFYQHPMPEYKYAIHNGYDPYGFSTEGLVLYLPLWAEKDLAFNSVDAYKHECTRTPSGHLHFTGANDSNVNIGDKKDGDKLWMSFWFRLDTAIADGGSGTDMYLIGKYKDADEFLLVWIEGDDGKIYLSHDEGGGAETISTAETEWAAGTWHHVIASCSTAAGQRLIVNGATAVTDAGNQTAISLTPNSLVFGNRDDGTSTEGLIGEMKEVVFGIDDLSGGGEAGLYAGTLPGDETEYWPMDEGTGTTINDQEGTADADGTADGACTWENVPMHWRTNGHYYDAFDDKLVIPDATVLDIADDLTIMGWVQILNTGGNNSILGKSTTIWSQTSYTLQILNNELPTIYLSSDGGAGGLSGLSGTAINEDTWYHLAGTFKRPARILYINGSADTNDSWDNDIHIGTSDVYIGKYAGDSDTLDGLIGEVWIYERALSAGEIAHNYNVTRWRYQ